LAAVVVMAVAGAGQVAVDPPFEVGGLFRVATPRVCRWLAAQEGELRGVRFRADLCAWEGGPTRVVRTVEGQVVTTEAEKAAAVAGYRNGMLEALDRARLERPETERPKLGGPIGERVSYRLAADDPTGARRFIRWVTIFGRKNVYRIQAIGGSVEEADRLVSVLDLVQE
jgi:hypothetical protein